MEPKFGEVWQWDCGNCHETVMILGPVVDGTDMTRAVLVINAEAAAVLPGDVTEYLGWNSENWKRISRD